MSPVEEKFLEAIREMTEQMRKLNELLAPELRKTETLQRIRHEKALRLANASAFVRDFSQHEDRQLSSPHFLVQSVS